MKYLIYLTFLLPSSCVIYQNPKTAPSAQDSVFIPYLQVFNQYYDRFYVGSIQFSTLKSSIVGLCVRGQDEQGYYARIYIDESFFKNTTEQIRWALLLHELGHCSFSLAHVEGVMLDGCPISLMNPQVTSTECYKAHTKYYWNDLRQRGTK